MEGTGSVENPGLSRESLLPPQEMGKFPYFPRGATLSVGNPAGVKDSLFSHLEEMRKFPYFLDCCENPKQA